MGQVTTMNQMNAGLVKHIQDKDLEHKTKVEQLEKLVATMRSDRDCKSLVNQTSLSKMKTFKDNMSEWHTWSFKFTNLVTSVFPEGREALEWARDQGKRTVTTESCEEAVEVQKNSSDLKNFNTQLHSALSELCDGEALKITENTSADRSRSLA